MFVHVWKLVPFWVDADEVVVPHCGASALAALGLDKLRHGWRVDIALVDEVGVELGRYRPGLPPVVAWPGTDLVYGVLEPSDGVLAVLIHQGVYLAGVVLGVVALVDVGRRVVAARASASLGRSPHMAGACEVEVRVVELDRPRHVVHDVEPSRVSGDLGLQLGRQAWVELRVVHQVFHCEPDVLDGHRVAVRPSRASAVREGVHPTVFAHFPSLDDARLARADRVTID